MCFNSRCQPPWLVILGKVSHVEKNDHNFATNCDIDTHTICDKKYLFFICHLISPIIVIYVKKFVCNLKTMCLTLDKGMI